MATGWSVITKENTNFVRLVKLLMDGGTRALRAIFDTKHPPHDLKKHLMDSRIHNILKNLRAKTFFLTAEQWNRLYPALGSATSADFDMILLFFLLRNICNLPTPVNGWDKEPAATSVNVEDDVVRLRLYRRNLCSHISEPALSDADFHKYWNEIENVLLRHGIEKTAIDSLKTSGLALLPPHNDSRVETEDYICPPVIIVGTHADELPGSEDEKQRLIDIKRRKIENAIEKCEFQNHVMKPFFVVDNNKSADDDGIKSLHSKINEVLNMEPYFPEPVPIRWLHFEKALQSLVQEKKTPFLSVKELSEIAEEVCSIDQTEIATMLNFYHRLGIIIKYGDTVVLDAKWLINLFKSLITIEPDEVKPKHRMFWRELAETGRLHTDLINHVFQELSEARDDAMKDILDMMEYFGLISKIIPSDRKKKYCHLVPSHLTSSPEDELKKCHPSSGEPCPLYIRFKDGFIPHGLYFQLICRWCSIYGSQERPNLFPREPKLFRNAAKFVLDNNSKLIMTVVCCKSTIKVCLHSNHENKTGVDFKAVEIRNLIQESLDRLTEKCPWYKSLQYELCIRCPLCAVNATGKVEGQPFGDDNCLHPATDDEEFYCEEKDEWSEVLGLHHWFSRRNSSASKPIHEVSRPEIVTTGITSTTGYLCLDENNKRWVVVGIAIMKVLLPALRSFVLPKIAKHYNDLKANHNIDSQVYGAHLKMDGTYKFNYDSINSNQGKKTPIFDYKVTSEVDLAKLYLKPFMAKFTGIDETCDLSAVLGILSSASVFTTATQDGAKDVRQHVRNEWGHCNFTVWNEAKITDCFKFMNFLVKSLKLTGDQEKKLLGNLKEWEEKGVALCLRNTADGGLLNVFENVPLVLKEVQSLKESNPEEFQRINSSLQAFKEEVIKCLKKLEEGQKDMKTMLTAVASSVNDVKSILELSSPRL
ncbi:E3 ubiquitin-protein ligase DZIP3 [Exaiptasia diaphana]|nr:E3 ubiquitin-protein ligase DZIP3 [Exaiptasia diaphana]